MFCLAELFTVFNAYMYSNHIWEDAVQMASIEESHQGIYIAARLLF